MRRIQAAVLAAGILMAGGWVRGQATRPEGLGHEAYRWRNVEIGGGGFVTGIVMHPTKKGVMYARTDVGGAYRFEGDGSGAGRWIAMLDWVTRKDWNLWGVESVAVDPNDATRVYLACGTYTRPFVGNGAILRSADAGRTFERAGLPLKMGGNEDGRFAGERLAVDGAKGSVLLFGSRNDGLWRSEDWGATWKKLESFPVGGKTNGVGIVFVMFESSRMPLGQATRVIYVGVSGSGASAALAGLYRSTDAGGTWERVPGQPEGSLMPNHAAMAGNGMMYLSYGDAPGPNGMTDGAVWRFNMVTGEWGDVTPARPGGSAKFGYGGVAVDAKHPGTVMATTMDRWGQGDDVYRSLDGGAHWRAVAKAGERDPGVSPWIAMGRPQPDAGHWMGDIEIDPFDSNHVMYPTGATIWESWDVMAADKGERTHWRVGAAGLEETVVLDLVSPPTGAKLISGVGDICGFVHEDLYSSPAAGRMEPAFTNTESIDYAGQAAEVIARVGTVRNGGGAHGAYSMDGGKRWKAFVGEPGNSAGGGTVAVSADGKMMVWGARNAVVSWSDDNGGTWEPSKGLGNAARGRPVADKVEAGVFYVVESATGKVLVSRDGGKHFEAAGGAVNVAGGGVLRAGPTQAGDLWFGGKAGLEHSTDGGKNFAKVSGVEEAGGVGFGRGREGTLPAVYLAGKVKGVEGIFRSDDGGKGWVEISDAQHEYSNSSHVTGDLRMYGRVYVGTPGRGVVFGDIDTDGGAGAGR